MSDQQGIFIVAGMHRSGTSFTASLLQKAGVDIGRRLMEANHGNVKGYFENQDFVDFHQTVLCANGANPSGWIEQGDITIDDAHVELAKELVRKSSVNSLWGWKDPRTTLFLDFWATLLPDANFIFIYRYPWEVIDSLYRRSVQAGETIFQTQPDLPFNVWMHYNQKVLEFCRKFPDRCLLTSVYQVGENPQRFWQTIEQKFNVKLYAETDDIYDRSLLNRQISDTHRPILLNYYFPRALELYQELNLLAGEPDRASELLDTNGSKVPSEGDWLFQDWHAVRTLKIENQQLVTQNQQLATELQHTQTQFQEARAYLEMRVQQTEDHLQHTQAHLQEVQAYLQEIQAQLQENQAHLQETHAKLGQAYAQQQQTQTELDRANSTIAWMETSKFWQLRGRLIKLKQLLLKGKPA